MLERPSGVRRRVFRKKEVTVRAGRISYIVGHTTYLAQVAESMGIDHQLEDVTAPGAQIGIRVDERWWANDLVYKIENNEPIVVPSAFPISIPWVRILSRILCSLLPFSAIPRVLFSVYEPRLLTRRSPYLDPDDTLFIHRHLLDQLWLEFDLLANVAKRPGTVYSRSEIGDHILGFSTYDNALLYQLIRRLRAIIECVPDDTQYVAIVPRIGIGLSEGL